MILTWNYSPLTHQKRMTPPNETSVWDHIVNYIIGGAGLTLTFFLFIWNTREKRKEIRNAKIDEEAKAKKLWADNMSESVTGVKNSLALLNQNITLNNEMLISQINEVKSDLKDFKVSVKDDINLLHGRITKVEDKFLEK